MIRALSHHGHLLRELDETYITFIPKNKNPTKINDFRPISLCSVAYKFISKLLANRLRECLPKVISPLWIAFVPNRDIHDNVLIAYETFSTLG